MLPDVVDQVVDVAEVAREAVVLDHDGVEAVGVGTEEHGGRVHSLEIKYINNMER